MWIRVTNKLEVVKQREWAEDLDAVTMREPDSEPSPSFVPDDLWVNLNQVQKITILNAPTGSEAVLVLSVGETVIVKEMEEVAKIRAFIEAHSELKEQA